MSERNNYKPNQEQEATTCQIRFKTESGIYVPLSENEPIHLIPFKEWSETRELIDVGSVIYDIPPVQLFTTQDWLSVDKMLRAKIAQDELVDDAFLVPGVIFQHPKEHMGNIPVLLEGNHRAVNAADNGYKLNFLVVENQLPEDAHVWRITNLRKKYPGLVRTL